MRLIKSYGMGLGVLEKDAFSYGTRSLAELIKDAQVIRLRVGGYDCCDK